MEVAERDVVDPRKHATGNRRHTAHAQVAFGIRAVPARNEGVGKHDASRMPENLEFCTDSIHRLHRNVFVRARKRVPTLGSEAVARKIRIKEGQPEKEHLTVLIGNRNRVLDPFDIRENVNAGPHEFCAKAEPHRRIVVAWREDHRGFFRERCERLVQKLNRLDGRDRAIVDIAGDHESVRSGFTDLRQKEILELPLVFVQVLTVQGAPEVPIRRVKNFHAFTLRGGWDI